MCVFVSLWWLNFQWNSKKCASLLQAQYYGFLATDELVKTHTFLFIPGKEKRIKYQKWTWNLLLSSRLKRIEGTVEARLKSWLFQASIRNCLNCVHNCDDHSLLDLIILLAVFVMAKLIAEIEPFLLGERIQSEKGKVWYLIIWFDACSILVNVTNSPDKSKCKSSISASGFEFALRSVFYIGESWRPSGSWSGRDKEVTAKSGPAKVYTSAGK